MTPRVDSLPEWRASREVAVTRARWALEEIERLGQQGRPMEAIARHVLGEIEHDVLLADLSEREYTRGHAPTDALGGYLEGYAAGTWDDIELAYKRGLLSRTDFLTLSRTAKRADG